MEPVQGAEGYRVMIVKDGLTILTQNLSSAITQMSYPFAEAGTYLVQAQAISASANLNSSRINLLKEVIRLAPVTGDVSTTINVQESAEVISCGEKTVPQGLLTISS